MGQDGLYLHGKIFPGGGEGRESEGNAHTNGKPWYPDRAGICKFNKNARESSGIPPCESESVSLRICVERRAVSYAYERRRGEREEGVGLDRTGIRYKIMEAHEGEMSSVREQNSLQAEDRLKGQDSVKKQSLQDEDYVEKKNSLQVEEKRQKRQLAQAM